MSFFLITFVQTPVIMPIFGQKNVNSAKTRTYYGPKKSKGCLFSDFSRKIECSHALTLPKISKIHPLPQKHCALKSFFQFCHENHPAVMPIFVPKT